MNVKRMVCLMMALVVCTVMLLGTATEEVSAATKKPSKVVMTSAKSIDYNTVKITWKKAGNTKKYQVYRATSKYGKYKLIKTTTGKTFTNSKLTTGKKYYYKVRAVNGSKKGKFSTPKYATPQLNKVSGVKAISDKYNSITLSWNKVKGANGYQIYKSTSKNGTYKKVKSLSANKFIDPGLATGKTYYYKVRAYRYVNGSYKYGAYSGVVSKATILNSPKITAQLNEDNKISISWNEVEGATGYKLYRSTNKNGTFSRIATTTSSAYTDSSAKVATTYYYKVIATRGDTSSGYSNIVSCKWELDLNSIRSTMLKMINEEREAAGVEPLEIYSPIHKTAQIKAEDLYETGVFDHYSDNLGMFYDQYTDAGITYAGGGENIAQGYSNVEAAMKGWMQSPGHKANILNENWTHVGIGYYKGNWVQQFAKNPKGGYSSVCETGISVECIKCGTKNTVDEYKMYSKDGEGNTYGCFYCSSCKTLIEKCSKCDGGVFEDVGLTENGSLAGKCNECGNNQTKTCYVNCQFCGDKLLGNNIDVDYQVAFDSTGTYDGESYDKTEGCYFQHRLFSAIVCKSCNKHVIVSDYDYNDYVEFYEKLKNTLGSEEEIFDYIKWEKKIGSELIEKGDNWARYKTIYEFIDTPEIKELSEIIGLEQF